MRGDARARSRRFRCFDHRGAAPTSASRSPTSGALTATPARSCGPRGRRAAQGRDAEPLRLDLAGSRSFIENFRMREGDVLYNCLPMYNSAAWVTSVYPALVAGLPSALDPRFRPASSGIARASTAPATPSRSAPCTSSCGKRRRAARRRGQPGAGGLGHSHAGSADRARSRNASGSRCIVQGYGQSECFAILNRRMTARTTLEAELDRGAAAQLRQSGCSTTTTWRFRWRGG